MRFFIAFLGLSLSLHKTARDPQEDQVVELPFTFPSLALRRGADSVFTSLFLLIPGSERILSLPLFISSLSL